ncbi:hypothetical protein C8J57DRAFT_1457822 [Mycena rebaudengoi]|nr:hypothetical protein C8J57DRAFT_1457822 [Mycena rebaudengoi]
MSQSSTSKLLLPSLSVTQATPEPSPIANGHSTPVVKGKRKADEVDANTTPPDLKKDKATTFAVGPRPLRPSNATTATTAPSSFHRQKRARISTPTDASNTELPEPHETSATVGSWSSRKSARPPSRQQSITNSLHRAPSRRSISQSSIPISALVSPHAPSVARSASAFHMRDPHKPPRLHPTGWDLSLGDGGGGGGSGWRAWSASGGSPLHAWLFFLGFVLFPLWWAAAFLRVLRTRHVGTGEKGGSGAVVLDDPQLEFDARTWRTRCRVMAAISLLTYIPFIILVAVFAR